MLFETCPFVTLCNFAVFATDAPAILLKYFKSKLQKAKRHKVTHIKLSINHEYVPAFTDDWHSPFL